MMMVIMVALETTSDPTQLVVWPQAGTSTVFPFHLGLGSFDVLKIPFLG